MLNKSTRPISTGLSEISETSHEPNSTQESESLDLADIESRDVTQYDDDSDRIGFKKKTKVGYVSPMAVVSELPHAEFGRKRHRKDAPHFVI